LKRIFAKKYYKYLVFFGMFEYMMAFGILGISCNLNLTLLVCSEIELAFEEVLYGSFYGRV